MKYASTIFSVRIGRTARGRWTAKVRPLYEPTPRERRTRAALLRLVRNLEHDLSECSCGSSLAGLLKHEYGAPLPRLETCPACELKNSLRLK